MGEPGPRVTAVAHRPSPMTAPYPQPSSAAQQDGHPQRQRAGGPVACPGPGRGRRCAVRGHGLGPAGHEPATTPNPAAAQCDRGDWPLPPHQRVHPGATPARWHLLCKYHGFPQPPPTPSQAAAARPLEYLPHPEGQVGGAERAGPGPQPPNLSGSIGGLRRAPSLQRAGPWDRFLRPWRLRLRGLPRFLCLCCQVCQLDQLYHPAPR